ncbi:hypothetical protein ACFWP3_39845 [Streptomyces sp. NPDC058525]|uniref:hypothetical protein n=1 Tax=Streptomyces sp. NPDC058525 TaxID=3346538 RepID=UPI003652EC53
MQVEEKMKIRTLAALIAMGLTAGCGTASSKAQGSSDSKTVTPSRRASASPLKTTKEATSELKEAMASAGIDVSNPERPLAPPHMADLIGTHDKETSRQALAQGYKNTATHGWKPTDKTSETFLHYEKANGCAAMSDATLKTRHPDLEPTDDLVMITIICPDTTTP